MPKVLVVDDDPGTVAFIRGLLEGEGYTVESSLDGASALDKARLFKPDAIVTDLHMPGLTGNQLVAAVRTLDRLRYVFILVLTVAGEKADKMKALLSGADDFVVKPARTGELLGRIEMGLRLQTAENDAREAARRAEEMSTVFRALEQEIDVVAGHLQLSQAALKRNDPVEGIRSVNEALAVAQRAAAMTRIRGGAAAPGDAG